MPEKMLVLDNIRSAHNVGSLFRTADGAGVSKIILGGYTPAPIDRFGRVDTEIEKTSLGATHFIPYEHSESLLLLREKVAILKNEGWTVVSVEQVKGAVSLYDFVVPEKVLYILGNEIDGVQKELIEMSDMIVSIPMHGKKESLNVSVAGGIVLFWR